MLQTFGDVLSSFIVWEFNVSFFWVQKSLKAACRFFWRLLCMYSILAYKIFYSHDNEKKKMKKKWDASWQNQHTDMCAQRRLRSAWASAQSDQSLRFALNGQLKTQAFFMRTAKTLIRLGGCTSWAESSMGAHAILLVLSRGGSNRYWSRTSRGGGFEKSKTNAEFERDLCQAKAWELGLYIIFVSIETQEE